MVTSRDKGAHANKATYTIDLIRLKQLKVMKSLSL